jgi:arginase
MRKLDIIGAATTFGQPRLGVDLGPDAIRYAGIHETLVQLGHDVKDKGNIYSDYKVNVSSHSKKNESNLLNFEETVSFNINLAKTVDDTIENGRFPLVLGGDHSLAIGSVAGISRHYEQLGVIWYDAHGDLNDSHTSPSGNIHGMPLAVSCGVGHEKMVNLYDEGIKVKPENVVLIGMRDLDEGEKKYIKDNNILTFTMTDIREKGIKKVMAESIAYLQDKTDGIHLSLDVDALDPLETPGTGTPVQGGLTLSETQLAMKMLHDSEKITSMDLVEVNPLLDEQNKTSHKAVEIAAHFFGKTQRY